MSHLSLDGTLTGDTGVLRLTEDGGTMVLTVGDTEAAQEIITDESGQLTLDTAGLVEEVTMEDEYNGGVVIEDQVITEQTMDQDSEYQNLIIQHMDIKQPLHVLRELLEVRLQCALSDHEFYLQDQVKLDPRRNLVSQCVQGSGLVQINIEVKSQPGVNPRLNIVDILKPAQDVEEENVIPTTYKRSPAAIPYRQRNHNVVANTSASHKVVIPFPEESENVTRWIVDQQFKKDQERLKIPLDPSQWNPAHVRHWLEWAVKQFSIDGVDIDSFYMTGKQLVDLSHENFAQHIPIDKGDVLWTHLELLRKCKFVAVIQQPTPHAITTITVSTTGDDFQSKAVRSFQKQARPRAIMLTNSERTQQGNRSGNNGQIQLWQFLLELLTDKDCQEVVHWIGMEGEFKLNNPEMVAQMWGQRKNKPSMNYEKMSRALRYYYDGDMIAKVHGKRFVYKFVCDLTNLLGYSAQELNELVTECAGRKAVRESIKMYKTQHNVGGINS